VGDLYKKNDALCGDVMMGRGMWDDGEPDRYVPLFGADGALDYYDGQLVSEWRSRFPDVASGDDVSDYHDARMQLNEDAEEVEVYDDVDSEFIDVDRAVDWRDSDEDSLFNEFGEGESDRMSQAMFDDPSLVDEVLAGEDESECDADHDLDDSDFDD
jgi:hypothetical protein